MRPRPSSTIIFLLIVSFGVALAALFAWSLDNRKPMPRYDPGSQQGAGSAKPTEGPSQP